MKLTYYVVEFKSNSIFKSFASYCVFVKDKNDRFNITYLLLVEAITSNSTALRQTRDKQPWYIADFKRNWRKGGSTIARCTQFATFPKLEFLPLHLLNTKLIFWCDIFYWSRQDAVAQWENTRLQFSTQNFVWVRVPAWKSIFLIGTFID